MSFDLERFVCFDHSARLVWMDLGFVYTKAKMEGQKEGEQEGEQEGETRGREKKEKKRAE